MWVGDSMRRWTTRLRRARPTRPISVTRSGRWSRPTSPCCLKTRSSGVPRCARSSQVFPGLPRSSMRCAGSSVRAHPGAGGPPAHPVSQSAAHLRHIAAEPGGQSKGCLRDVGALDRRHHPRHLLACPAAHAAGRGSGVVYGAWLVISHSEVVAEIVLEGRRSQFSRVKWSNKWSNGNEGSRASGVTREPMGIGKR